MVAIQTHDLPGPINIDMKPMSDADFLRFCQNNPDYRIERDKNKRLIIMPPTGSETGNFNSEFNFDPILWNRKYREGFCFDSSTGFTLPNGAIRSPDFSWVEKTRWNALPKNDRRKFAPICPDFVVEIYSPSDILETIEEKMDEYMENGCRLGWLINPQAKTTHIYRANTPVIEIAPFDKMLSGEDVLVGFETLLADLV